MIDRILNAGLFKGPRGSASCGIAIRRWGFAGGWLVACGLGLVLFWQYKSTGQVPRSGAVTWPRQALLELDTTAPTLVMFVHPRCQCTRASLSELQRVLSELDASPRVTFVVYQPEAAGAEWQTSPTLETIRALPGTTLVWDAGGKIAARCGAVTSGHVQLIQPSGECLFSGGITRLRGHAGSNAASDQLLATLQRKTLPGQSTQGMPAEFTPTTVYGCALQSCP